MVTGSHFSSKIFERKTFEYLYFRKITNIQGTEESAYVRGKKDKHINNNNIEIECLEGKKYINKQKIRAFLSIRRI